MQNLTCMPQKHNEMLITSYQHIAPFLCNSNNVSNNRCLFMMLKLKNTFSYKVDSMMYINIIEFIFIFISIEIRF